MRGPVFPGVRPPSIDMQAVRDGRRSTPLYVDVPLTAARSRTSGTTTDVTDTSGKALVLNIAGNSFYSDPTYDTGGNAVAGNAIVHFQELSLGAQGTPFMVTPQFVARVPFTQLLIENYAQAGKILRVIYGVDIDFQVGLTANVAPVQVIDGGKSRTLANQAFISDVSSSAVAAVFSHVQMKMPAAATKRAIITQIMIGSANAGNPAMKQFDTDLTTLSGNAPSKNINGAVSVSELRNQTNAAQLGTGRNLLSQFVQASVAPPNIVLREPIILAPGRGIVIFHSVVNQNLSATFEFIEEDNV